MELNELSGKITSSVREAVKKVCSLGGEPNTKLSPKTMKLIKERRTTNRDSPRYKELDKSVKRGIRKDLRAYNTQTIKEVIEDNMNMKALRARRTKGKPLTYKIKK